MRSAVNSRWGKRTVFALGVAALHVLAGIALLVARPHWPFVLGFAGLAYTLGVRHAFDADHIVAIDGTTRHLLAQSLDATGVGFWFALGHSTVVMVLALWIAHATRVGAESIAVLRSLGGLFGLATSSAFLLLVAAVNIGIFADTLRAVRRADAIVEHKPFGFAARLFQRPLRMVRRPGNMYVVGFLFGLGLDTASEIALLAMSATAAAQALPTYAIVVLPLAFAAGMSLADSVEGSIIAKAYGWSQGDVVRRARYNLVVTGFTALAAVIVGALELSGLGQLGAPNQSTAIGAAVATVLLGAWGVSALLDVLRRARVDRATAR